MDYYCEEIMTVPWRDPDIDHDGDGGWVQSHYWTTSEGGYTVCDAEGDHDEIDAGDLPTHEEHTAAWAEYARWVLCHGEDPLGEYLVKRTRTERQRFQVALSLGLGGVYLRQWRRGDRGAWQVARLAPAPLREYLLCGANGRLDPGEDTPRTLRGLLQLVQRDDSSTVRRAFLRTGVVRADLHLDARVARPVAAYRRELRRLARRHLTRG